MPLHGSNILTPVVRVHHSQLERWWVGDVWKSKCVKCAVGFYGVTRDPETMRLRRRDRCVACLQRVLYLDAEINGEGFTNDETIRPQL